MVTRKEKEKLLKQRGKVLWFTGLPCSGKTTIATALELELLKRNISTVLLDGDAVRTGINNNLGFSEDDRKENIRRIAEISKLLVTNGIVSVNSFVSPTEELRELARNVIGAEDFYEIFVNAPPEVCEKRDVKGMYKKARAGQIKNFTGVDAVFEIPKDFNLEILTNELSIEESVNLVLEKILPQITI